MSLKELQDKVKPLTLPEMLALRARAEQDAADTNKIFFERVFQQWVLPFLIRQISQTGSEPEFGCSVRCWEAFDTTRVPIPKENPKFTKEVLQSFVAYVGERLRTVFPDYDVKAELKVLSGFFWGTNMLNVVLTRKDPLPAEEEARKAEKATLEVRNPQITQKNIREPFVLQHKEYK